MAYRNLIFDFDGTITDSRQDIARAQLWVLEQLGVQEHTQEDLFPHIGKTLEETFALLLPPALHHRIPEAAEMYAAYYRPRSLDTTTLFPGVRETLAELRRLGRNLAVASTKRGAGILRATDHFMITRCFAQLQGSDGIPHKPHPFIIDKIVADQGWTKADTLMVGDTDKDMLAAKNAGVSSCAVTYGALTADQLSAFGPDFMIDRFPDLLSIV
jgi:phosphoglycolate phosphatase